MKTILVIVIILAILAVYFVLNVEKSFSIKSLSGNNGLGNALPAGTDITKFILRKVKDVIPEIAGNVDDIKNKKLNYVFESKAADEIKSKIGDIKNKITSTFCAQN